MKAKRIVAGLIVASLAVSMTACGSSEVTKQEEEQLNEEIAEADAEEVGANEETPVASEEAEELNEEIAEEALEEAGEESEVLEGGEDAELYKEAEGKTYVVGTDTTFAPFEFENDEGVHTGIDIELLEAIGDEMGFSVEWQILGFSASVAALEANQVDAVMAGMSITDERKEKYDFSESYYDCAIGVAVASDSDYETLDDLTGTTVVCKTGTTGSQYAEELAGEYDLELLYVEDSAVMYQYVDSGQAVACFEDYPIIQYEIARGNIDCNVINTSDYSYPTGLAVLGGNYPELVAAFNEGFNRLKDNGTYDEILAHYFE